MTTRIAASVLAVTFCLVPSWGQARREADIGYIYPAGGQQGTVFQVVVGGQLLRGTTGMYITGEGVSAAFVEYWPPLSRNSRGKAGRHIRELVKLRVAQRTARAAGKEPPDATQTNARRAAYDPVPVHPWFDGLDDMTLLELVDLTTLLFNNKVQDNAQLAEGAVFEVSIDADAPAGDREFRLITRTGMSNPMVMQVDTLPEIRELEPNDPGPDRTWPPVERPEQPLLKVPVLLNGQIMPGDVDRHRIQCRRGQKLVVQAQARHLVPYLADAVPGWFQATLALYDSDGRELAYADDFQFNPDPVLYFEVPESGEYLLEVRDFIYRGREDFVYRIRVGELPFITWLFPLGGPSGAATPAEVGGWNLPRTEVTLDTDPGGARVRTVQWPCPGGICNRVTYAVDDLPEVTEAEPNDAIYDAMPVTLPQIVNGRIGTPGDTDFFTFTGKAGNQVVAKVMGRRLNSPIDSLVRLIDSSGAVVAWNDDHMEKDGHLHTGPGLITHHADSYLLAELPTDGKYCVMLSDTRSHGSDAHGYRLHITPAMPDFELRVSPSCLTIPAGRTATVRVHALRSNGFDGEIEMALRDAPEGFGLSGVRIPAGIESLEMTITAPPDQPDKPVALQFEGTASAGGRTATRLAVPSDDTMQAFLWRHLVPAQEMLISVTGAMRMAPTFEVSAATPVRIPLGGTAEVKVAAVGARMPQRTVFQLVGAPDGLTLQKVQMAADAATLILHADDSALQAGQAGNLVAEATVTIDRKLQNGQTRAWRVPLGALPAIGFEIVQQ